MPDNERWHLLAILLALIIGFALGCIYTTMTHQEEKQSLIDTNHEWARRCSRLLKEKN